MTRRVVGVGSRLRGDDAAGLRVAEALAERAPPGVEVRTCEGSVGELVDALGGATDVVLVDAVRGSGPPGTVTWCPDGALPPQVRPTGTHDMGLAEALGLIVALDQAPARLTVVGIEGADFTLGRQALTPAVAEAVARVTAELADANADADA